MSLSTSLNLMMQRRFVPIWAAQTLGAFNDNLLRWSLVMLAAYQGFTVFGLPRAEMAPIAAVAFTLPLFMFSAVAGQFVDTVDRMSIMRSMKLLEIVLMVGAVIGFMIGQPLVLLLALFAMGVQSAFFNPARHSSMPTLLKPDELIAGNGLISGAVNVAVLVAATLAALLMEQRHGILIISSLLIGFSVLGWLALLQGLPSPPSNEKTKVSWNIVMETWKIFSFMLKSPMVLKPLMGVAWFWTIAAAFITLVPIFVRDTLGGDPGVVAIFQILFTIGTALGALICSVLTKGGEALKMVIAGAVGIAICSADLAISTWNLSVVAGEPLMDAGTFLADPNHWQIMGAMTLAAICGGLFLVPQQAMAQRRAQPSIRGRLMAGGGMLNGLGATLGPLSLVVWARLGLPIQTSFIVACIGMISVAIYVVLSVRAKHNRTSV